MSQQTNQTAGWIPNLTNLGLPQQLTDGITQSYTLLYSLRDTATQTATGVSRMNQYGAHNKRVQQVAAASAPNGGLYFETDRATAFYQSRLAEAGGTPRWFYAGGIYYDVLANRPADLGTDDTGFLFLAGTQLYRWNGTSWDTV